MPEEVGGRRAGVELSGREPDYPVKALGVK